MSDPVFSVYLPQVEIFRGTMRDLADPNVVAYCGPQSLTPDPSKPLILIRFPA